MQYLNTHSALYFFPILSILYFDSSKEMSKLPSVSSLLLPLFCAGALLTELKL